MIQLERDAQAAALLKASAKPVLILAKKVPGQEVLDLVKKKEAAVGLILVKDTDIAAYYKQLDKIKEAPRGAHRVPRRVNPSHRHNRSPNHRKRSRDRGGQRIAVRVTVDTKR